MTSNILVISPTPSAPQDGGNRKRIDWLLSQLADRGHQIHFLLYNVFDRDELVSDSALAEMQSKWATVSHLRARLSDQKLAVKARRSLLKSRVYRELATRGLRLPVQFGIDDWCGDDLLDEVRKQFDSRTFDAVLVEYVYLSRALTVVPDGVAKIIDTHDVFSDRHRKLIRGGVKPGFFTTSSENERRGLNRADVLLAIQQEETNHFRRQVDERVDRGPSRAGSLFGSHLSEA
jgi:polysaccharide biosynthesis protein PslH